MNKINFIKLPFKDTPFEIFSKICKRYSHAYLLESMEGPEKLAQYSFIGFKPRLTVTSKNNTVTTCNMQTGEETHNTEDPLEVIRAAIVDHTVESSRFRLAGGAVGYISYDAVRNWEQIPDNAADDLGFPDIEMGIYDDGLVFDHKKREGYYYYTGKYRLEEVLRLLKESAKYEPLTSTAPTTNITKKTFMDTVTAAKEYITAGDIFQVVLAKRYEFPYKGDLIVFYGALRKINPSPYMYYLKAGDRQIIGSSPEMLVRIDQGTVDTFPIAGTRPYVDDPEENQRLAEELLADPKERAEHIMLVDLARNDIGRISQYGSVNLPEFMTVHQYSHVQHIVTQVNGKLDPKYDAFDALQAVFPAGTVSGAPKVRAMEIIDELEPTRRGPYAGAVGYFSYNGCADFAITIRTLIADAERASIQVGAGIVADSVPETEWFETDHKAAALLNALEHSGGDQT